MVKCYNHRSTLGTSLQCIITCSNFVLWTTGSDSVMCAKFQINLTWYADLPNEERYQRDSPESYKGEILESLQNHQDVSWAIQRTFFHQRRLFRSFVKSFKWFCKNLQTFRNSGREKKVVKCYNHWSTLGTSLQCIITCSNFVLSTTGSDSVMCAKFEINLMRYGEFPNEQRYKRDSLWRL